MRRLSTLLAALLVLTCVAPHGARVEARDGARRAYAAAQSARVGREFKIRAGRSVTFRGEDLRLRLAKVESDSRCPKNVDCVWAGNAEVLIEVSTKGGRGRQTLRLNTNAGPERPAEGKYRGYTVRLVGLSPYPRGTRKIGQGKYTATLLVSKE
jgi:hypothetical protein